jgi:hypothetical protein
VVRKCQNLFGPLEILILVDFSFLTFAAVDPDGGMQMSKTIH